MLTVLPVLALLSRLAVDSPPTPPSPPRLLPRSSIAAVLARRGELGLDGAEVKRLEERDAALQKRLAEIREQSGAAESRGPGKAGRGSTARPSADAPAPPSSPSDPAHDGAGSGSYGGGRHRGGGGYGGHRTEKASRPGQDPGTRAAQLQQRLDDADTAAWLEAETLLEKPHREPARDVAETYREALADQRDAERQKRP